MSSVIRIHPASSADGEPQQGPATDIILTSNPQALVLDCHTPNRSEGDRPRLWLLQDAGTLKVLILPDGEDCTHELHIRDGQVELIPHRLTADADTQPDAPTRGPRPG